MNEYFVLVSSFMRCQGRTLQLVYKAPVPLTSLLSSSSVEVSIPLKRGLRYGDLLRVVPRFIPMDFPPFPALSSEPIRLFFLRQYFRRSEDSGEKGEEHIFVVGSSFAVFEDSSLRIYMLSINTLLDILVVPTRLLTCLIYIFTSDPGWLGTRSGHTYRQPLIYQHICNFHLIAYYGWYVDHSYSSGKWLMLSIGTSFKSIRTDEQC